ncbi:hypothetical protein O181_008717 [Austropuccinia psidii MF-1]|uniref:Retrotransposon gag domain-containing protein n=1 Tax=Austropuccinia psidii MF-1 TaxID=1389203 RepID=A0A9Q3GJM8_9BASI|nr:hypothetical protein [Austropuccinia psidii MF-1]
MEQLTASMDKIVKSIQEGHAQLRKASEETNKGLNKVFEEQNHCRRDIDFLNQDLNKLFNVYHNMNPQPQGPVLENPYHQEAIKPDALLEHKERSPSQYQDAYRMSYSEKEALKKLPEASRCPKFSGTGENNHMELIYYTYVLLIDVPSIPDFWITARLNTEFEGNASIWYTEIKEIHGRRNWPWWKSIIIQKYSNGTWIWQRTMTFKNEKYSVDKDPHEWCLRQYKRLKTIDSQMNIQMRSHKLLTQLENAVKGRFNKSCTLDDIANTLQDIIAKKKLAEVPKKKNSCHNGGSTDHYSSNCPNAKKKVYTIEKVPEEESLTWDFESESMGDAIREKYDEDQDPREELLVEYQEETQLQVQDIPLESGI